MLGQQKSDVWMRGANIETGGGREGGKYVSGNGILYNRMHVKTRLSQSILSKIVACSRVLRFRSVFFSNISTGIDR